MTLLRAIALTLIGAGLATMVLSAFPFAQAAGDPGQANFAGAVSSERRQIVGLGIVLVIVGAVAYWKRLRWLLAVSFVAAAAVGVVAVRTISRVANVVASAETDSEVGWALYVLCACSVLGVVTSALGLRTRSPEQP